MGYAVYVYTNAQRNQDKISAGELNWTGTWSSTGTYFAATWDSVMYGNDRYIAVCDNIGVNPVQVFRKSYNPFSLLVTFIAGDEPPFSNPPVPSPEGTNLAYQALTTAWYGTALAYEALTTAWTGTAIAGTALALAEAAGTGTFTQDNSLAYLALTTAWTGTATSVVALQVGDAGTNAAASGINLANSAFTLAEVGTKAAASAVNLANNSVVLAEAGTAAASSAISLANTAVTLAETGTATGDLALSVADTGTNLASTALTTAWYGTSSAYTALQEAWAGTSLASNALTVAEAGTALAYTALTTAWTGTFAGSLALHTGRSMVLCAAYTPATIGADPAELTVPYSPLDGVTALTWIAYRANVRVNVAGGAPSVAFESSSSTGAFAPTAFGTVTLGNGASEGAVTGALASLTSGNKVRFNPLVLGSATNWTVTVEIGAQL